MNQFTKLIAAQLNLKEQAVENTLALLEEGCTNVTAWVPLRNERALRFHESAGFKREMSTAKTATVGAIKIEEVRMQRSLMNRG